MKELIRRIRENKYLTRNETDFIIKALEENSSLRKQVNMWQSEHAKRVLELGKLREGIKLTREEIAKYQSIHDSYCEHIEKGDYWEGHTPNHYESSGGKATACDYVLRILDKLIESEER